MKNTTATAWLTTGCGIGSNALRHAGAAVFRNNYEKLVW